MLLLHPNQPPCYTQRTSRFCPLALCLYTVEFVRKAALWNLTAASDWILVLNLQLGSLDTPQRLCRSCLISAVAIRQTTPDHLFDVEPEPPCIIREEVPTTLPGTTWTLLRSCQSLEAKTIRPTFSHRPFPKRKALRNQRGLKEGHVHCGGLWKIKKNSSSFKLFKAMRMTLWHRVRRRSLTAILSQCNPN